MQKNDVTEFVLGLLNEMSLNSSLTTDSYLKDDVEIDSIGWLRCLIRIEEKYKCSINPEFLVDSSIITVQDFIDKLNSYLQNK